MIIDPGLEDDLECLREPRQSTRQPSLRCKRARYRQVMLLRVGFVCSDHFELLVDVLRDVYVPPRGEHLSRAIGVIRYLKAIQATYPFSAGRRQRVFERHLMVVMAVP